MDYLSVIAKWQRGPVLKGSMANIANSLSPQFVVSVQKTRFQPKRFASMMENASGLQRVTKSKFNVGVSTFKMVGQS
jgi:hypothetical protein